MGNNSNFEEQCVQLAHEEWIGWLELSFRFNPFVGVANKFLWKISQRSHLVKLKKGQQVTLPHGGYIYEGLVERFSDRSRPSDETRYIFSEHNVILPHSNEITA